MITTEPATATTAVLDTTAATPAWKQTEPMLSSARVYHTLTMLANGQVLAVGGGKDKRPEHGHDRRSADRDLGSGERDMVGGGADLRRT